MVSTAEVTKEQRRALLQEILTSERFRRSKRLSDFLRCVVDAELSGLADRLTEQQIGQQVYGKPPGYNAAEENVVRVEARRLRLALGAYFNEEGRHHEWVLEIPRGHYVPLYRRREDTSDQASDDTGSTGETPVAERRKKRRWLAPSLLGLAAGFVLGMGLASYWGGHRATPADDNPILASLNTEDRDTLVVVADSQWAAMQQVTQTDLSLSDYLDRDFSWDQRHPSPLNLDFIASRQFVAVSNVHFLKRMIEVLGPNAKKTAVRFARDLRPRDLRHNNLIFLGSARSIPWVELFEDKLNFVLEGPHFHNRTPRGKEKPLYKAGHRPSGHREVLLTSQPCRISAAPAKY